MGALGFVAFLLLAAAAVPAHRARWYWAQRMLIERREQLAISGVMCVAVGAVVSALVLLGG